MLNHWSTETAHLTFAQHIYELDVQTASFESQLHLRSSTRKTNLKFLDMRLRKRFDSMNNFTNQICCLLADIDIFRTQLQRFLSSTYPVSYALRLL